jgi:hypothetical protein
MSKMSQVTRVKEALKMLRYIPAEVKIEERPMVHIMKGLISADDNLQHEMEALFRMQERIKEIMTDINRFTAERAEYSKILNAAYSDEEMEAFLARVEEENVKWCIEKEKEEVVQEGVTQ